LATDATARPGYAETSKTKGGNCNGIQFHYHAPAAAPAGTGKEVLSPLEGKFFLVKSASDTPVKVGDVVKEGDVLCYVEAMKTYNAVRAEFGGTVTAICLASGDAVSEDDVLMTIQ